MNFQPAYKRWIDRTIKNSSPERRRRLQKGLGHAEFHFLRRVWWPAVGTMDHLHPEYEVADFDGISRFVDFAYLRADVRLAIEIDGFTTHAQNINRDQFAARLRRQNMLTLERWDVLRFAYHDVEAHPRQCQTTIQQYMGSRFASDLRQDERPPLIVAADREIIRLARSLPRPVTPRDVMLHLDVSRNTAYRYLRRLVRRRWLLAARGTRRIRSYKLKNGLRSVDPPNHLREHSSAKCTS